MSGKFNIVIIC